MSFFDAYFRGARYDGHIFRVEFGSPSKFRQWFGDKPTPGAAVTAETPLKPGMMLLNERSGNRWRPVTVLELRPNGDVKIHFINWGNSWDTVVKRATLRLPPDESINQ